MRTAAVEGITAKSGAPTTTAQLESVANAAAAALLRPSDSVMPLVSLGRAEEARARKDDREDAVYSAILDGNACHECEAMDGQTTTDLGEAEGWTPNGACQGGGRCRCVTVYQLRQ